MGESAPYHGFDTARLSLGVIATRAPADTGRNFVGFPP